MKLERLNLNHLFYFYIVAKEGSIKEASEKVHVTQPTISDQIKLLEEYLGCNLFERKHRGLFLTDHGKMALKYAESIFDLSSELTARLRNNLEYPKRTLDIGISHNLSNFLISDGLRPLFNQKEVRINVKEDSRIHLLAELEEGHLDMIFTDQKENLPFGLSYYGLGKNKTYVVAHKKYKGGRKGFPKSLNQIPYFSYTSDSSAKYEIDIFFAKHSLSPRTIGEADDIDLLQMVTEEGLAFTIVPEVAKNRFCLNKDVVALGEVKELQISVWGVIKKGYRGPGHKFLTQKL